MTTYMSPLRTADGRYDVHPEIGLARRLTEQARLILGFDSPQDPGEEPEQEAEPAEGGLSIDAMLEKQAGHPLNRGLLVEKKRAVGAISGIIKDAIGLVSFDPNAHPRDYRGRFLTTGDDVDLPDGRRGVIETLNADGTMSVLTDGGVTSAQATEVRRVGGTGVAVDLPDGRTGVAEHTDATGGVVVRLPDNSEVTAQPADLVPSTTTVAPTNIQYGVDGRTIVPGAGVRDAAGHVGVATLVDGDKVTVDFAGDTRLMRPDTVRPTAGTVDSEFPSPLDERLVNHKPNRDLTDPTKTVPLAEILPTAEYQAYSQVPFLPDLHERMGVTDPLTHDVTDYMTRRDDLFNAQPLTSVALDHVVVTQRVGSRDRINQLTMDPSTGGTTPAHFVRFNGATYVMNGHHRVAAQILGGDTTTTGRVLDLDRARADDPTMDGFTAAGPDATGLPEGIGRGAVILNSDGHLVFIADASDAGKMRGWDDDTRAWVTLSLGDVGSVRVAKTSPDAVGAETLSRQRAKEAGLARVPKPDPVGDLPTNSPRPGGALAPVDGLNGLGSLGDGVIPRAAFDDLLFAGESPAQLNPAVPGDRQRAAAAYTQAVDGIAPALSEVPPELLAALTNTPLDGEYALTRVGGAIRVTEAKRAKLAEIAEAIVPGDDPRMEAYRRRALAGQYTNLWEVTAGDSKPRALAMQQVAADLFGLTDATQVQVNPIIDGETAQMVEREGPAMRAYLTGAYAATQAHLAAAGVDSIVAYRGMSWRTEQHPDWANQPQVDLTWRPMSSWSADPTHAQEFSDNYGSGGDGVVVAATIPRDRILGIPSTGPGGFDEYELVVLSGPGTVSVVNPFNPHSGLENADRIAAGSLPDTPTSPTWHSPAVPLPDLPSRDDLENPDEPGGFAWQKWADFYVGGLPSTKGEDYTNTDKLSPISGTTHNLISHEARSEAKAAVVKDLAKEMELVSDEDMFRGVDFQLGIPGSTPEGVTHVALYKTGQITPVHEEYAGRASANYDTLPISDPRVTAARREAIINAWVAQWATTSNDGAPESHAMQEIAAEHFGLTDTAEWDMAQASLAGGHDDIRPAIDRIKTERGPVIRAFLQAQYDLTQRRYAEAGITQVEVYRGMGWAGTRRGNNEPAPDWAQIDADTRIALRPLSSWSVDRDTADQFGRNSGQGSSDQVNVLVGTTVPVERILSTPRSGVGALNEWEVVVIGGNLDVTVRTSVIPAMTDAEANAIPAGMIDRESDFQTAVRMASTAQRREQLMSRARDHGGFWKHIPPEWYPDSGLSPDGFTFDGAKDETSYEGKVARRERAAGMTIEQIKDGTARDLFDALAAELNGVPNRVDQNWAVRRRELIALWNEAGYSLPGVKLPNSWN